MTRASSVAIVAVWVAVASAATGAQSNTEEFARRQYDSGLSFMENRRYVEALKDFQSVIESFPNSAVADNALLRIALYHLDVTRDIAASQSAVDTLLKKYPDTDSAAMAHVVSGRLALVRGRTSSDVDGALASFERVSRLFPGDEAVPAAGFYAGDALRTVRRNDEALERFRRVALEYPRSIWAARANLAAGWCLVQAERAPHALEELQRIRRLFPGSPEAATALNDNSILYRLYVRPPSQAAYTFAARYVGSETARFKDVIGVAVDAAGRILLGHKLGVSVFDPKGALTKTIAGTDATAFFVDERGRVITVRHDALIADGGESIAIAIPSSDGKTRQVEEIPAGVALSDGTRILVDRKAKNVIRVSSSGKYIGPFAALNAERLTINGLDDVAILTRDTKSVTMVDRDGKTLGKISSKGTGYEFDNPIDVQFDAFGHLYVLDRGRASVFVFGPKNRLITTINIPEKNAGAFPKAQAFALDAAGRLFIYDDRAQRIQVYQ